MFIIQLNEGKESLADIERICQHLTEHKQLIALMTPEQRADLCYVLKPTLARDHDEEQKREHWDKLLKEFVMSDTHGNEMHFYRDPNTQYLYFGNQQGFDTIEGLQDREFRPPRKRHD